MFQGLESKCSKHYNTTRSLQLDIKDRDEDIKGLKRDLSKKISYIDSLKKDLKEANDKVRGVTNMEWKGQ